MRAYGIAIVSLLLAAACSAANPAAVGDSLGPQAEEQPQATVTSDEDANADAAAPIATDAGTDAFDAADAFDGFYPPPASECNPDLTIGAASTKRDGVRFAGITRDERTIAWTSGTSLFIADDNGTPVALSSDAASDGVAITDDGLTVYAVAPDHRSFIVYTRPDRDSDFEVGDDSMFDPVIEALAPEEEIGDPVFVNSGLVFLYSVYGKSADTMRMANRISIYASFFPAYTLAFEPFRANGDARRRPTGTGEDFQVIFYWDEVSKTEKLARLNGTEMILGVKDLGAHPWAQATADCSRVYFGNDAVLSAPAR